MIAVGDLFEAERRTIPAEIKVKAEAAPLDRISSLSAQWQHLSAEDKCVEPFFQPEWFQAYAKAFEPGKPFLLLTAWKKNFLRGVLPLIRKRTFFRGIPARTLKSLSGIHSCRYDLVHGAGDARPVAEGMWESLKADDEWEVIEAFDVPEGGAFENILRCAKNDGYYVGKWSTRYNPFLPISPEATDPFVHCPEKTKSTRSRLEYFRRKLERKAGPVSFHVARSVETGILGEFYALEASGWKGKAGSAIAKHPDLVTFYNHIGQSASARGAFRMYSLTSGDKLVAMEFGLVMNGCYYSPKAAYNEEFAGCSPGHLLTRSIIEDLWELGVKKYDFLGPLAKYKCVWTPAVRPHNNLYVFRPGLKGKLLHSASMEIGAAVRRWKYRLYGDPQDIGN